MRRLLQISDVHFGPPQVPRAAAAILRLAEERMPDLVVLAGDLTQRAKPWQFAQARDFMAAMPAPVFVVPGNHDVPLYRVWERVFAPFAAYRRGAKLDLEPTWQDDELDLFGINTAHGWTTSHGRFRNQRLRAVAEHWPSPPTADPLQACRIVVAHHPMILPESFHGQRLSWRSAQAAKCFAAAGVDLVLSGHVHHFHCGGAAEHHAPLDRDFLIAHSGTACSNRGRPPEVGHASCNWIEIGSDTITVQRLGMALDGTQREFKPEYGCQWDRRTRRSIRGRESAD